MRLGDVGHEGDDVHDAIDRSTERGIRASATVLSRLPWRKVGLTGLSDDDCGELIHAVDPETILTAGLTTLYARVTSERSLR